jgi:tRNA(fMet)-specific endonuclease VapC
MHGRFLLDTNIAIGLLEGDAAITTRLNPLTPLYLPSIAVGELFFGAYRSGRVQRNLERVVLLTQELPVLACDLETADRYGALKQELRKKGRPVPDNDIWVAAISQQHNLTLITRDRHFREFASLQADFWS